MTWKIFDRKVWFKMLCGDLPEANAKVFDPKEIAAIVCGTLLAIILAVKGDLETAKTLGIALIFFAIGRSAP